MTRRDIIGLLAGGVVASILGGCGDMSRKSFRFRMMVEVETPQGLKTGSSVMELSTAMAWHIPPETQVTDTYLKGEAVAVDLPGGQALFALVGGTPGGDDIRGAVINTFDPKRPGSEKLVAMVEMLGRKESLGRAVVMRPDDFPKLVRFRDIRDPKSVELVDPNDLTKSFGAGSKLRRIVLTVTHEPVTTGIEKRFSWVKEVQNTQFDGSKLDYHSSDANRLNLSDFRSWEK
jgi:hypothetical protein